MAVCLVCQGIHNGACRMFFFLKKEIMGRTSEVMFISVNHTKSYFAWRKPWFEPLVFEFFALGQAFIYPCLASLIQPIGAWFGAGCEVCRVLIVRIWSQRPRKLISLRARRLLLGSGVRSLLHVPLPRGWLAGLPYKLEKLGSAYKGSTPKSNPKRFKKAHSGFG
jgi:hypothetical protein